jgi:RES domain-containing protein
LTHELVTFRLANYETPLWSVENFAAGRYNRADAGYTQYLSLHPLTPWAELLRNEDRRTRERALLMRYPLWVIRVRLAEPPLALTFDAAAHHGLLPEDLVADDHAPCRALAQAFRGDGPHAFLAPSAALPGTTNLVVLEPRVLTSWSAEPIDEQDWPGAMTSQDGRCPEDLWDLVHYRDSPTPHPALTAWRDGRELVFEEPEVRLRAVAA